MHRSILAALTLLTLAPTFASAGTWTRKAITDQLTGKVTRVAFSIDSANAVSFGFPYGGPHHTRLYLFYDNTGALESGMVGITGGQILHREGGRVLLDGNEPQPLSLSESADSDSKIAFFDIPPQLLDAKSIKLEITFFREGTRVLTFTAPTPLSALPSFKKLRAEFEAQQAEARASLEEKVEAAREAQRTAQVPQAASELSAICALPRDSDGHVLTSARLRLSAVRGATRTMLNEEFLQVVGPYEKCLADMAAEEALTCAASAIPGTPCTPHTEATSLLTELRQLRGEQ